MTNTIEPNESVEPNEAPKANETPETPESNEANDAPEADELIGGAGETTESSESVESAGSEVPTEPVDFRKSAYPAPLVPAQAPAPVAETLPTEAPAVEAPAVDRPVAESPWALPTRPAAEQPTGDVWAVAPEVLSSDDSRKPRRAAQLRWAAAALILLLSGTAAAAAVTAPARTDIPGLETPNDGRYVFPALALPPLPAGKAAPHQSDAHQRHYADLRQLLLPAPKGATVVAAVPAASPSGPSSSPSPSPSGPSSSPVSTPAAKATASVAAADWVRCTDFAAEDKDPAKVTAQLDENACRAATKRVWTAKDGTRTEIWLLRFGSYSEANSFYDKLSSGDPKDIPGLKYANADLDASLNGISSARVTEKTAGGRQEPVGRQSYLVSGDVTAIVSMTNPQGVPLQAFRQVTVLQADLLY